MTREEYIDEFIDCICTEVKDSPTCSNYLDPSKVIDIIGYRLQWLFDNYTFIKKDK